MKAYLKLAGVFFVMIFMAVSFTSCGDDDEEFKESLVGTWVSNDDPSFTLILNADHTGEISYTTYGSPARIDRFDWSTTSGINGMQLNVIHTWGDEIIQSTINNYVLARNGLILTFQFNGGTRSVQFTRK